MSRAGSPMWVHGGPSFTPQWESGDPLLQGHQAALILSPAHHSRGSTQKQSLGVGGSESCPPIGPSLPGTRCLPAAHSMGCSNCTHPKGVSPAECSVHIRDRPWSSGTAGSTTHGRARGGELRWQPEDEALLQPWLVSHEPPGRDPCLHHSLWLCPQGLLAQTPGHLGLDCRCQDHTESRQPHNAHVSKDTGKLSTHSGSKAAPEMVRVTRVTTCCGLHVCVPRFIR